MPNLITKGQAIVGKLTAAADLNVLNTLSADELAVTSSVSFPSYGSVAAPAGGGTVDAAARTAIGSVISVLQATGLLD